MPWNTMKSEDVVEHPYANFKRDVYKTREGDNEIFYHSGGDCVLIVPVLNEDELVMILNERYVYGKVHGEPSLEFPAGFSEEGESVEESAAEELREETGYTAGKLKKIGSVMDWTYSTNEVHIFLATDLEEGEQELEGSERIKVVKKTWEEAKKNFMEKSSHAPSVSALFMARELTKNK